MSDSRHIPKQQRSIERVNLILETAAELIREQGSAEAKTSEIAKRAGISLASLYRYFPNLFVAVRPESTAACRFWVALVLEVRQESVGDIELLVRWYNLKQGCAEGASSENEYSAPYVASTVRSGRRRVPHTDVIPSQSVLVEFEKLTSKGCLYRITQNAIRATLESR